MIGCGGRPMWCHLRRPGPFWGAGEGEETRKRGLQDSDNGPIQFNGINYLYLSSLAGEHSHRGFDEAGESS
jgi:hypothetical protein